MPICRCLSPAQAGSPARWQSPTHYPRCVCRKKKKEGRRFVPDCPCIAREATTARIPARIGPGQTADITVIDEILCATCGSSSSCRAEDPNGPALCVACGYTFDTRNEGMAGRLVSMTPDERREWLKVKG